MRPPRRRTLVVGLSIATLAVVAALYFALPARRSLPNLLLITIDTLRADHVGAYGARGVSTPALDRLSREGVQFSFAYAPVPLTLPSHASILSGVLPVTHGMRGNDASRVPESIPLVTERLRQRGYETAGFVSAAVLSRATGINRGFDYFDDETQANGERPGGAVTGRVVTWLRGDHHRPFFLWVHFYDAHLPYDPPEPYRTRFVSRPYDGEVAYVDSCIATLVEELNTRGMLSHTAIVVVGDHGEGLGDHGESSHGALLYEPTLRVPLIVRRPGTEQAGRVVESSVSITRIADTLLDLASRGDTAAQDSLLTRLGVALASSDIPVVSETLYLKLLLGWSPLYSLRLGRFKYIDAPHPELYDLVDDPGEMRNLASKRADVAGRLHDRLHRELSAAARGAAQPVRPSVSPERAQALAALGYVSGTSTSIRPVEPVGGIDPNERIGLWVRTEEGLDCSHRGDQAAAAKIFESISRDDPENVLALKFLGARALQVGDIPRAIDLNQRVVASGLHLADAYSNLAVAYGRIGRLDDALRAADLAVKEAPEHVAARFNRALVLSELGRRDEAMAEIGEVLRRQPGHRGAEELRAQIERPPAATDASALQREAARFYEKGDLRSARERFERALALEPLLPGARLGLGMLDVEEGRPRDAIARLEPITTGWPGAARASFYLAEARRAVGDAQGARRDYRACLQTADARDPIRETARKRLADLK